jgi:glycosyltransferase involved in cell wall biosynthesis
VPVVATNIAGVPSLIQHGDTGLLIEPGDGKSLDFHVKLSLYGETTGNMVHKARKLIEERFSFKHRIRKVADIYDSLQWIN